MILKCILWASICVVVSSNKLAHSTRENLLENVILKSFYPAVWYQPVKPKKFSDPSEAAVWLDNFNDELEFMYRKEAYLSWKFSTNITPATEKAVSDFAPQKTKWMAKKKKEVSKLDSSGLDPTRKRMIFLIRNNSFTYGDEKLSKKNAEVIGEMSKIYSTTRVKMPNGEMKSGEPDLANLMSVSRSYDELLFVWETWRASVGPKIKPLYLEMVKLQRTAARAQGYKDMAEVWKMEYEREDLEEEAKSIWLKIKPLYEQLHAYVRRKLSNYYGKDKVDPTGPIPAHLLGNLWSQEWGSIMDIVKPKGGKVIDITKALKEKNYDVHKIFKTAEDFYTSMGLFPMTDKFWRLSMLKDPGGNRKVDCHGSAEDFYSEDDFRIKMCTKVNSDSFFTAHHEMGHIQYFMAYQIQPTIFKSGANPAFHEAIGDAISYSVMAPEHLKKKNLIDSSELNEESEINYLLLQALKNLVLIPWTLLVDLWRYDVFKGKIDEKHYNEWWWKYRLEYQGIKPPTHRNESFFDPAAKYHIPHNVPYIRYFFARVLQMQFHATMCDLAHGKNVHFDLHKCDVYNSKNAGYFLKKMMSLGSSRPWWDALEVMTGSAKLDANPILQYYKPLHEWLKRQNAESGEKIGW